MRNNSRDLAALQGPEAQREADSRKDKCRSRMLIGKDRDMSRCQFYLQGQGCKC